MSNELGHARVGIWREGGDTENDGGVGKGRSGSRYRLKWGGEQSFGLVPACSLVVLVAAGMLRLKAFEATVAAVVHSLNSVTYCLHKVEACLWTRSPHKCVHFATRMALF